MANEYIRKQYAGGAAQTTITGAINDTDTSITIASGSGWPSGATPFCVTIDPNKAVEETLLVTRSGTTLTVVERGYDGTTAVAHSSGVAIIHSHDAHSDDQANRLANLQTGKGDLIVHNGTNPVALDANLVGDGTDDGMLLRTKNSAAGGWEIANPATVTGAASAPNVATTVYRLWYDTELDMLRWSDGTAWAQDRVAYYFANITDRKALLVTPKAGQVAQLGTGIIEVYTGTAWRPLGLPVFASVAARDAYFADATVGLQDGVRAYTTDTSSEWSYRDDEWILRNFKVTMSASSPTGTVLDGDIWLQPVD